MALADLKTAIIRSHMRDQDFVFAYDNRYWLLRAHDAWQCDRRATYSAMNSRRRIAAPKAKDRCQLNLAHGSHVRFGSKADICSAKSMSALPPIATAKAKCRK